MFSKIEYRSRIARAVVFRVAVPVACALTMAMASAAELPIRSAIASTGSPPSLDDRGSHALSEKRPLTVADALAISSYGSADLSPDGEWLAYSLTDGATGKQAVRLNNLRTGETQELAPVPQPAMQILWSPDSQRLAFHAGAAGARKLWLWERDSRSSHPVENGEAGLSDPADMAWFADSRRLLRSFCARTAAQNPGERASGIAARRGARQAASAEPQIPLSVFRANMGTPSVPSSDGATTASASFNRRLRCTLVIEDTQGGSAVRIAEGAPLLSLEPPSPDGRFVAYSVWNERRGSDQLDRFDLHVRDVRSGSDRILVPHLTSYGGQFSWAPDSKRISYLTRRTEYAGEGNRDAVAPADLAVVSVSSGRVTNLRGAGIPELAGKTVPVWTQDSRRIASFSTEGELWLVEAASGSGSRVKLPDGWRVRTLVRSNEREDMLASPDNAPVFVAAVNHLRSTSAIFAIDLHGGAPLLQFERAQDWSDQLPRYIDISGASGDVVFIASDHHTPGDLWLWHPGRDTAKKIGTANRFLDEVALGDARRLQWRTASGEPMAGTLLVPPGHRRGQRVPLLVWVYGGAQGSEYLNKFGFTGGMEGPINNVQLLASRGYAVLFPDTPQHVGTPMRDLLETVMPGVDAAIDEGIADPGRLAVSGHSYGSYSTLALIAQTTRFRCAIISAVVDPNLFTAYLPMRPDGVSSHYWSETGQGLMGGTPWQFPERYRDNSPVFLFDRIQTPVLIGQGDLDLPSPKSGAAAVFVALRRLGKPVEYRLYAGEGHTISRPANVEDFWNRRFEFLAETLDVALDEEGRVIMENGYARSRTASLTLSRSDVGSASP